MKQLFCLVLSVIVFQAAYSQQKLERGMNYLYNAKPNNIIYHDTLYKGAIQFHDLFYRDGNPELMRLYQKHQTNKILGQVISFIGAVGTGFGIGLVASGDKKANGTGWALLGGGFVTSLTGGYLMFRSQVNMQMAVTLFNARHNMSAVGIGMGDKQAGLIVKF